MSNLFSDRYQAFGYSLTSDPLEADNGLHYSDKIEELIQKAYRLAHKPKKDSLPRLLKLVNKYPHVPAFKNYLTSYYMAVGNTEKAHQANRWLVKEHPDYLYGKLNLAGQYIFEEKFEEAEELLGKALDLQEMYPDREVFHVGEWISYLNVSCHYLIAIGNLEAAASRIYMANEMMPGHPVIQELMAHLARADYDGERTPTNRPYDPALQTNVPPTFAHPEIKELYKIGFEIDPEHLKNILALPTESLVGDLKKVLQDSIYRYEYFIAQDKLDEKAYYFPIHALALLTELKAEDSLDIILDYLTNSYEILNFWLDDHYTESICKFISHLGQDQLPRLQQFQFELNVHQFSKGAVVQVLNQIALNQSDRKEEVKEWYCAVFKYFLANSDNDDLIDTALIGFMVYEYKVYQGEESLSLIKQLYEQDLVSEDIAGTLEEFEESWEESYNFNPPPYINIFSFYTYILEHWEGVVDEQYIKTLEEEKRKAEEELESAKKELKAIKQRAAELGIDPTTLSSKKEQSKVGRNDLCPCGSGKKYKKCCMRD